MIKFIDQLVLTLAFLSRIPLPKSLGDRISHDARLSDVAGFFPIAGFVIAILPAAIWYAASIIFPSSLAAGLALLVCVMLTGGLHEDGLADCADGLGATSDKTRVLEIMRDSQIGTYGAIALIFTLGLRWVTLAAFTATTGVLVIFIAFIASRASMTIAMRYSNYARTKGLGAQAQNAPTSGVIVACLVSFAISMVLGGVVGLIAVLIGFLAACTFLKYLEKRIGGYTGDGLGAMQQICEISILLTLTGFWT